MSLLQIIKETLAGILVLILVPSSIIFIASVLSLIATGV